MAFNLFKTLGIASLAESFFQSQKKGIKAAVHAAIESALQAYTPTNVLTAAAIAEAQAALLPQIFARVDAVIDSSRLT